MKRKRPVILGYDLVSPLGTEIEQQWARALAGESGVGPLTRFELRDKFPVVVAGQVPEFDESRFEFLKPRAMAHWSSPVFKHSLLVVHRALERAGVEVTEEIAPRVGITFSTAIGGLDAVIDADRRMNSSGRLPGPFVNPNSCINMVAGKISILTGATGPITTSITACATGNSSVITGALFIESGMADVVICGAVDFPLIEPIVAGFATMNGAYKEKPNKEKEPPEKVSRPFSLNRRGFVVSEGAGCIVLASPDFAAAHGLKPQIELAGYGMTSDANHFVAPNLPTVVRCIKETLANADLKPGAIDAINAHAASTKVGDMVEARALTEVFGDQAPPVSANKSMLGHAMGASSALEAIFGILGMLDGHLPPTLNFNPDPEIELDCISSQALALSQEFLLKNSFGFGGCNSCLLLRRMA